jgi:fatty acid desaturase
MAKALIPVRLNIAIAAGLIALNGAMLVLLLSLLRADPSWGWLLVLPVALTTTLWAVIHEAIHGGLHPDRRWNDRLGRALSIVFGSPFQLLRLGHLMHHRHNRSPINRIEVRAAPEAPPSRGVYYARLLGGLYLGELLAAPLAILPARFCGPIMKLAFGDEAPDGRTMWEGARRQLLEQPGRNRMRLDGLLITLVFTAAFLLYGPHWWMLALALAGRAFLISFFDNVYHYRAPLDDVMGGHDLRVPALARALVLNFNYHATHHRTPDTPWTALPEAFGRHGGQFDDNLLPATLRQLQGPLPAQILPGGGRGRQEPA